MNLYEVKYQGNLRTTSTHLDSGSVIETDAPKDNHGLGETFSPTDMLCSALASCILTIMAIGVEKNGVDIKDTTATVKKTMGNRCILVLDLDHLVELIFQKVKSGDMVLTMGAGSIWRYSESFYNELLKTKENELI